MKLIPKIAGSAVAVLALGGAGITAAAASSASPPAAVRAGHSEPTGPDTDAIQQGDQTSPDNAAAAARAGTARSVHSVRTHSVKADPSGEGTSSEGDSSDGPGGHADPAGNVQHEFNGVE